MLSSPLSKKDNLYSYCMYWQQHTFFLLLKKVEGKCLTCSEPYCFNLTVVGFVLKKNLSACFFFFFVFFFLCLACLMRTRTCAQLSIRHHTVLTAYRMFSCLPPPLPRDTFFLCVCLLVCVCAPCERVYSRYLTKARCLLYYQH